MTYDEMVKKLGYSTCTRTDINPAIPKKEHNPTDFANAKIVVGNRIYPTTYVNYVTTHGEYPSIEVKSILNPYTAFPYNQNTKSLEIVNVIFNPPATIVFWSDNTKTVVKADYGYDSYDPEKGIAMAISKKMLGDNKYEYYNTFKHWLKKWNKQRKTDAFIEYLEKNIPDDNE